MNGSEMARREPKPGWGFPGRSTSPLPATAMLSRVTLASYIMVSAERRMLATVSPSSGKGRQAEASGDAQRQARGPSRKRATRRSSRSAMVVPLAADLPIPGSSATNSSPP